MSLKLITPPAGLVVSLVEARAHLRVDGTDDDTLITAMIGAATDHAEQMTGRALLPQTLELTLDAFPAEFELTRQPVTAITSIIYQSTAAALVTLSNTLYTLDASDDFGPAKVTPAYNTVWPDTLADVAAVKLRYVAGYANAAAVPEAIKSWIKLQVGAMYAQREAFAERQVYPLGFVDALLDRYRVYA